MNDMKKVKNDSYPADMSSKRRARRDRKKTKNFKSPDISQGLSYYHAPLRLWIFGKDQEELDRNKARRIK